MNSRQLRTIMVAALFLIGGATAVGAAAPADQASDTPADAHAENMDDADSGDVDSSDVDSDDVDSSDVDSKADKQGPADAAGVGPSDGLPEQVPDHVGSILDTISSFQNGGIGTLGESLSSLVGGGPADNAGTANA